MRKKLFVLILLLASNNIAYGKNGNKTKPEHITYKKLDHKLNKAINRYKRSSSNQAFRLPNDDDITYNKLKLIDSMIKSGKIEDEQPFWGSRGRRDSSSLEYLQKLQLKPEERYCYRCNGVCFPFTSNEVNDFPFWGNRGRRDSDSQSDENSLDAWDNRVRRQDEEDDPFWGSRGRRNEDPPFWGSRGRREHSLGAKQYFSSPKSSGLYADEDEPFWGNRGRRKASMVKSHRPNDPEPFWGSRGKKRTNKFRRTDEEKEPFWGNRGRRKIGLDNNLNRDDDIENMSKMKRKELSSSFWTNRDRNSRFQNYFMGAIRNQMDAPMTNDLNKEVSKGFHIRPSQLSTTRDDRIYAEEPRYILIERNSRSSLEDDPYMISRGKKYSNLHLPKAVRDRRGAIEDIVKSVQNDPYYIARGKKDSFIKIGNTLMSVNSLSKDKEAVCALVNSILAKNERNKIKRDVNDSERDRRTILNKLAAQLQEDPYFVSRGKKDLESDNDENIKDFVEQIIEMCY